MSHTYQHRSILPPGPPSQSQRQPPPTANGPTLMIPSVPGQQSRGIVELADILRTEAENMERELVHLRNERGEFEGKINEQVSQLAHIRTALNEIKAEHQQVVQAYELQIEDLKKQVDLAKGGPHRRIGLGHDEPPAVGHGGQNLFGGVINRPPHPSQTSNERRAMDVDYSPAPQGSIPPHSGHHHASIQPVGQGPMPPYASRLPPTTGRMDEMNRDSRLERRERDQEPDLPNKRMRTENLSRDPILAPPYGNGIGMRSQSASGHHPPMQGKPNSSLGIGAKGGRDKDSGHQISHPIPYAPHMHTSLTGQSPAPTQPPNVMSHSHLMNVNTIAPPFPPEVQPPRPSSTSSHSSHVFPQSTIYDEGPRKPRISGQMSQLPSLPLPQSQTSIPPPASHVPSEQPPPMQTLRLSNGTNVLEGDVIKEEPVDGARESSNEAVVHYNNAVPKVLDVKNYKTFPMESVVCYVHFSPDGKTLAVGCNNFVFLYDTQTSTKTGVLNHNQEQGQDGAIDNYVRSICFSPDGRFLATGSEDRLVRVWDMQQKRQPIRTFTGHTMEIYALAFSPSGKLLVSGSGDRTARVWDLESANATVHVFEVVQSENVEHHPEAGVTSVAFSPDGKWIATGNLDTVVRIWGVQSGKVVEKVKGHRDSVYAVAFSPDGSQLVSGSLDRTVKVWSMEKMNMATDTEIEQGAIRVPCINTLTGHKDYVLSVGFSPDGQWIFSGSKDRCVQIWDAKSGLANVVLQGHRNSVISISVSKTGDMVASGSGDCLARIWSYHPIGSTQPNSEHYHEQHHTQDR